MHTQQSGVIVITINLMHFIDSPVHNLNCFITYNVVGSGGGGSIGAKSVSSNEAMARKQQVSSSSTTTELQMHVGKLMLRAQELFTDTFWVTFDVDTGE